MVNFQVADKLVCKKRSSHYECLFAVALLTAFFCKCCDDSSFSQMKQRFYIESLSMQFNMSAVHAKTVCAL